MFVLATSRYQSGDLILASGLLPCISVGKPKFPLGYTPLYLGELAPYGLLGVEDGRNSARATSTASDVSEWRFSQSASPPSSPTRRRGWSSFASNRSDETAIDI